MWVGWRRGGGGNDAVGLMTGGGRVLHGWARAGGDMG